MGAEKPIHGGHRQRVKKKFLEHSLTVFEDHEILELLLFYAIPQKDTNPLAHELLNTFGSIDKVFDAPIEELQKVPGVGENAAVLIKMIPQLAKCYKESAVKDKKRIYDTASAVEVLEPKFIGEMEEIVVLMLLGSDGRLLLCKEVNRGSIHEVPVYVRDITSLAIRYKADTAIIAHNHPSGSSMPSGGDLSVTAELMKTLETMDITLADHIIFTRDDFSSMKKSHWIDSIYERIHGSEEGEAAGNLLFDMPLEEFD